jgi:hypothetical protein
MFRSILQKSPEAKNQTIRFSINLTGHFEPSVSLPLIRIDKARSALQSRSVIKDFQANAGASGERHC